MSSLGIHPSGFVSPGPSPQATPSPNPSRGCGCHIAACGALQAADSASPRPRPGARRPISVPSAPPHPRESPVSPGSSSRVVWGPATPVTSHRAQLPRQGFGELEPRGRGASRAPMARVPQQHSPSAAPTTRASSVPMAAQGSGCAERGDRRWGPEATGPGAGRGRGSCGWGGAPPRSGYRRGPSPGAGRAGIPAARREARDAACARATGRIQAAATPAWLRTQLRSSLSGSRRWGADQGLLRTAASAREGGGSQKREEETGGGGMNHRGGRARPPSLCRSGPGGAGAPASLVAPRASAHPRSGLGHSDFARLFGMEGPFPLLLLPRKVISRHPRGLGGQFEGPVSVFLIMEVNLIEFTRRWGWDIRGIYF